MIKGDGRRAGARQIPPEVAAFISKTYETLKYCQGKSWSLYLYFAYKSAFHGTGHMKAVEAVKVKLWCFKGTVNPRQKEWFHNMSL